MTTVSVPSATGGALLSTAPLPEARIADIWRMCGWAPHALQRKALLSRSRMGVLAAGRRVGKSQTGGYKLVPEAFRAYAELPILRSRKLRREYWIVGPEYSDAEKEFRVVWEALASLGFKFDRPGSYNNPSAGEMRISMFDGRFIIHAKSAKYPGTLVGEGLSGVVFSEAAKLKPSIWDKFIRPTLADFGGWAFFGSTPEGRNWFYDFWEDGQDPRKGWWDSWRAPAWVNPYVYPGGCDEELLRRLRLADKDGRLEAVLAEIPKVRGSLGLTPVGIDPEIFSMFSDLSSEMFSQEVEAEFTEFVGRVFKDYDEMIHVVDHGYYPDWTTYACVDYGFQNPFVWLVLQVDPHRERVHVVDEYYETGRTTEEAAIEIRARGLAATNGQNPIMRFFPDPAEPDRTRELERRLEIRSAGGTATPLNDRLEWIRRKLKLGPAHLPQGHPERLPYLTINRRCRHTRREMGIYKYPETADQARDKNRSAPEAPEKKDDHAPEALGRFFSGFLGSPWAERGSSRQSQVRIGRRR